MSLKYLNNAAILFKKHSKGKTFFRRYMGAAKEVLRVSELPQVHVCD